MAGAGWKTAALDALSNAVVHCRSLAVKRDVDAPCATFRWRGLRYSRNKFCERLHPNVANEASNLSKQLMALRP
jgi:hypothetical protein